MQILTPILNIMLNMRTTKKIFQSVMVSMALLLICCVQGWSQSEKQKSPDAASTITSNSKAVNPHLIDLKAELAVYQAKLQSGVNSGKFDLETVNKLKSTINALEQKISALSNPVKEVSSPQSVAGTNPKTETSQKQVSASIDKPVSSSVIKEQENIYQQYKQALIDFETAIAKNNLSAREFSVLKEKVELLVIQVENINSTQSPQINTAPVYDMGNYVLPEQQPVAVENLELYRTKMQSSELSRLQQEISNLESQLEQNKKSGSMSEQEGTRIKMELESKQQQLRELQNH